MRRPVLITAPETQPVSLAEAKLHLRVDHNDEDAQILGLIRAATEHLDGWTGILGQCVVEQTWRQDFDALAACVPLPLGPVLSITEITVDGEPLDDSSYSLAIDGAGRGYVEFDGVAGSGPVSITYKAGYALIPEPLKVAILLLAGHWYQNREAATPGALSALPMAVDALIAPYRRVGV